MPLESFPVRAQLNATFARRNRLIVARRLGVWAKVTIKTKTDRKSAACRQPKSEAPAAFCAVGNYEWVQKELRLRRNRAGLVIMG
jgi:hypothetical protein